MVVVVVIAVAMVPFLDFLSQETRSSANSLGRTVGMDMAIQVIERLRLQPAYRLEVFANDPDGASAEQYLAVDPLLDPERYPPRYRQLIKDYGYQRRVSYTPPRGGGPDPSCMGILSVKVTWRVPNLHHESQVTLSRVLVDDPCLKQALAGVN